MTGGGGSAMNEDLEAIADGDVCELAKERHRKAAQWLGLWTALIFALAIILAVFVITALWSAFDLSERKVAGLVGLSASVAQGAVLSWFVRRRREIRTEETEAFAEVERLCGKTVDVEAVRSSLSFFGIR